MDRKDLTPEQLAKAQSAKTADEIVALAQEEGIDLSDEELEKVSGGWAGDSHSYYIACGFCDWGGYLTEEEHERGWIHCPKCGALQAF